MKLSQIMLSFYVCNAYTNSNHSSLELLFSCLTVHHNRALDKGMNKHIVRVMTIFQIRNIFAEAYLKDIVPLNASNGFSKCDIFPLKPGVISTMPNATQPPVVRDSRYKSLCGSLTQQTCHLTPPSTKALRNSQQATKLHWRLVPIRCSKKANITHDFQFFRN